MFESCLSFGFIALKQVNLAFQKSLRGGAVAWYTMFRREIVPGLEELLESSAPASESRTGPGHQPTRIGFRRH